MRYGGRLIDRTIEACLLACGLAALGAVVIEWGILSCSHARTTRSGGRKYSPRRAQPPTSGPPWRV